MFSWGSKPQKELSLAEKLALATKKTRADLTARINKTTENAKKESLSCLLNHSATSVDAVCTLDFDNRDFALKIEDFIGLTETEKNQVVTNVCTHIKEGGVEVFQSGNVLTVKWNPETNVTVKKEEASIDVVKEENKIDATVSK